MAITTPPFEPINLDDLTVDPKELAEIGRLLADLSRYCRIKADAMGHRLKGNIGVALIMEARCELLHRDLPEWARW